MVTPMPLTQTTDYDVSGNFLFDSSKVEFTGTEAQLKLQENTEAFNEDFADDTGFTYNASLAEFSGGQVQQVAQTVASETFRATFNAGSVDALYAAGTATGTANNGAVVSGNKLVMTGASARKYVDYAGALNADSGQVGAVRFKVTPNYSGGPATDTQFFFSMSQSAGSANNLMAVHHDAVSGNLRIAMVRNNGVSETVSLGAWSPVSGTEYEFELNWNVTGGGSPAQRLFIDGVQFGSTATKAFTRTDTGILRLGNSSQFVSGSTSFEADFSLDDVQVFDSVQHTANYTPGAIPSLYAETPVELPQFSHSGPADSVIKAFDALATTEAGSPRYTVTVDSGTEYYWTGAAWAASSATYATASSASDVNTNIATIPGADGATDINVIVYFPDSDTISSVSDLTFTTTAETQYPTDNPTVVTVSHVLADALVSFSDVTTVAGSDEVRWTVSANGTEFYWDGAAWSASSGYAQTNTAAEVSANAGDLDISSGVQFKMVAHLHSDDGSTTPSITSHEFSYSFFVVPATAPNTCIVYGWLWNLTGTPNEGATVTVDSALFPHGEYMVNFSGSTTTNSEGYWELAIVETASIALSPYTFKVADEYIGNVQVPDAESASFTTLIPA